MTGEASAAEQDIFKCHELSLGLMHHGARRRIVEAISLDVRRGEFLTIVGASGTGKTTLLRLLGGLIPASSGTILFHGKPVERPARWCRGGVPGLFTRLAAMAHRRQQCRARA